MQVGYICDYCQDYDRKIMTKEEAIEHEKTCIWNPNNKSCWTCRHDGTVKYKTCDSMGNYFIDSTRGCTANHRAVDSNMLLHCEFHEGYE